MLEAESSVAWYERVLVEGGVGGTAKPSASYVYPISGADLVSCLGIESLSERCR